MNDTFLSDLKQALDNCISDTDSIHWMFCNNPESDFSRERKILFADYCNFMIQMQSKSLHNEVMDFFGHTNDCPTTSAFVQQKYKFRHESGDYLFHLFARKGILTGITHIMVTSFLPVMVPMSTLPEILTMKKPISMRGRPVTMPSK